MNSRVAGDRVVPGAGTAVGLCASLALVLGAALVVVTARYLALSQEVEKACGGVVAALDLTEWVPLCR